MPTRSISRYRIVLPALVLVLAAIAAYRILDRRAPGDARTTAATPAPADTAAATDDTPDRGSGTGVETATPEPGDVPTFRQAPPSFGRPARASEPVSAPAPLEAPADRSTRRAADAGRSPATGATGGGATTRSATPSPPPARPRDTATDGGALYVPGRTGAPAAAPPPIQPSLPSTPTEPAPATSRGTAKSTTADPGVAPTTADDRDGPPETVPLVSMAAPAGEFAVGERIVIAVDLFGGSDVGHVPFHVVYDPAVLRFEYGEEGPFLRSDGRGTAFFAAPTSSGNEVVVGLSRLGRGDGIDGSGRLCLLYFTAVGPGNAGIGFTKAKVRDSYVGIVRAVFQPVAITVR